MKQYSSWMLGIPLVTLLAACQGQGGQETASAQPAAAHEQAGGVPIFDDLGTFQRTISTRVPEAQRYFDQGMRLTYAFNHAEAIRAFDEAARVDPDCAICYWGTAYAYGPNINAPMDSASGVAAHEAAQRALALADGASPVERALIQALAQRYAAVPPEDRAALDQAYARAMGEVARAYPDDVDVVTLHAEARMNLSPWDYWTRDGNGRAGTAELVADLERVLAREPNHPGACHYYIHAVEAVQPEKAVACAERLAALMPGAGHLVHMPAHIYIRVGRWADAITANEHAVHADETYIADQGPSGVYPVAYYPHNYHFLSFAATMVGRSQQAIEAARGVTQTITPDLARMVPPLEPLLPYVHLTLVTFGRWDDVLNEPEPPSDLRYATAMVQYARGVAFAAKQNWAEAQAALTQVRAIVAETEDELSKTVLDIAHHTLAGEIAARQGQLDSAESHFRAAMRLEDGLLYMEPPHWYYPVRHSLGDVLLKAGRAADAEALYREDLKRFPENGWSLHGLAASLRAQNKTQEADDVQQRFDRVWNGADIQLTASRF